MSYKFLKISDTYDIRDVEEYTPYSEPRMSRDMWRDEVLSYHDDKTECCGVLYKICNEYKVERDVAERKLDREEMENRRMEDVIKGLEEKVTNLELQNQQLVTEKEAAIATQNAITDNRNFVIILLVGVLFGVLLRF